MIRFDFSVRIACLVVDRYARFPFVWYLSGTVIFLKATIMANTNSSTLENPKPCDLDYADPDCKILFSFTRVDPTENPKSASFGYNFRYTNPWSLADTGTRSLTKVYGTRIVFQVVGDGAQFDVLTLTVRLPLSCGCSSKYLSEIELGMHMPALMQALMNDVNVYAAMCRWRSDPELGFCLLPRLLATSFSNTCAELTIRSTQSQSTKSSKNIREKILRMTITTLACTKLHCIEHACEVNAWVPVCVAGGRIGERAGRLTRASTLN